jgi:hypothetical protein
MPGAGGMNLKESSSKKIIEDMIWDSLEVGICDFLIFR